MALVNDQDVLEVETGLDDKVNRAMGGRRRREKSGRRGATNFAMRTKWAGR